MKIRTCHALLAACAACTLATAQTESTAEMAATPASSPASAASTSVDVPESTADTKADDASDKKKKDKKKKDKKKKDKKKKDKKKDGDGKKKDAKTTDAKDGSVAAPEPEKTNNGDWCEWLSDSPGLLYDNKSNPWLQSFEIGGRFHYQVSYQDGSDVNDRDYHDTYEDVRRFRIETQTRFLQYFDAKLDVNLVSDDRFRTPPDNDLDWGYDDFDTATLGFDLNKLFKNEPFDTLELVYGKMKLPITEEQRMSSNKIYTIERSMLTNKLGGAESRPTGLMLEIEKLAWSGSLGVFSGEKDADFLAGWSDGEFYFANLCWQPSKDLSLTLDYVFNGQSDTDNSLGYRSAVIFDANYERERWGILGTVAYGDNGSGDPTDKEKNRVNRVGDFYGVTVMPWYWLVEKKLQLVFRYEYGNAQNTEGLQLTSRYIRGNHDDELVDVNNGRGDLYNSCYLGLNYHICGNNAKIMGGVLSESLSTPEGVLDAMTYTVAFRAAF